MSFPMRSLAEAATQTLTTVILFLKSHSPVPEFSPSLFEIASFFIFSLILFIIGALSSFHFQQLDTMETVHRNPIPFFSVFLSEAHYFLDDETVADVGTKMAGFSNNNGIYILTHQL